MTLGSTALDQPTEVTVDGVVRGHLDLPSLARSTSLLLNRLYAKGRLTQLRYGDTAVGSVAISEDFHPYDAEGRLQPNLSLLGVLTEGVRYFTHYLPSPAVGCGPCSTPSSAWRPSSAELVGRWLARAG